MAELGDRERIALRRRFVIKKRVRESMAVEDIVDAWNAKCLADGRPDDQRGRSTIFNDLKENLRILREEGKLDTAEYREMLAGRLEYAISRERFLDKIENGDDKAVGLLIKAVSKLSELYGANMPIKVANTDAAGNDLIPLTDQERAARLRRLLETAEQRALEATGEPEMVDVVPAAL